MSGFGDVFKPPRNAASKRLCASLALYSSSFGAIAMSDAWPMPRYPVPDARYLHALGVISLNYNAFEHTLFAVFSHHLKRTKVPGQFGEWIFNELNMHQKTEAIRKCFEWYEADPATLDAIDHLLLHFHWCFETRNTLLHAHTNSLDLEEIKDLDRLPLAKAKKGSLTKLNFIYLSLTHLRAIADHMHEGYEYLLNVFMYMQIRDGQFPLSAVPKEAQYLLPRTLPRKPDVPKKIRLQDSPVTPEAE